MFGNPLGEPAKGGTAYRGVTHLDGPVRMDAPSSIGFSLDSHWYMGRISGTAKPAARVNSIVPGFQAGASAACGYDGAVTMPDRLAVHSRLQPITQEPNWASKLGPDQLRRGPSIVQPLAS